MRRVAHVTEQPSTEATDQSAKPLVLKTAITLSADARRRLETAKLVDGGNFSTIIDGLITKHLVGYYAGRRGRSSATEDSEAA